MKTLGVLAQATLLLLVPLASHAFGANGHRVVGEIAAHHLSPAACSALDEILGGEPLAFAATWPDEMRSNPDPFWSYDAAANWHFINVPPDETYAESPKEPKGDAFVAINTFVAILEDSEIPKGPVRDALTSHIGDLSERENRRVAKQYAARFIVHIVGDLHQPLHLGYAKDNGGNDIEVEWFGREQVKLHEVWDTELVEAPLLSFSELVSDIDRATPEEVTKIQRSDLMDWINESLKLRVEAYDTAEYDAKFSYSYTYRFVPVIESQMLKGGLRAASLFNRIFEGKASPPSVLERLFGREDPQNCAAARRAE